MNTRHNYFPLKVSRRLGSARSTTFSFFSWLLFSWLPCVDASLKNLSPWSLSHFVTQRMVPLLTYIQDIDVPVQQCQQKNEDLC